MKSAAGYLVLPGVIPRTKEFFSSGFGFFAHLIALIYAGVGLLPQNHPYTLPTNIGRFGLRHVIVEASNRLVIRKENFDQIIIFFALLLGIVILFGQVFLLGFSLLFGDAHAGLPPFVSIFVTPGCDAGFGDCEDMAFALMHEVFRIPGLFSDDAVIPPLNDALHNMFEFYNIAILLVAVLIFIYYLFLVVGETAMTGTPFGRRFNHIWAPLRLVMALGLLVPMNYGLNSGQYIALFSAKWGSSFATNIWYTFNQTLSAATNPNGMGAGAGGRQNDPGTHSLIAHTSPPDMQPLVEFMSIVLACKEAYNQAYEHDDDWGGDEIEPYWVFSGTNSNTGNTENISTPDTGDYGTAETWFENRGKDIVIVFGRQATAAAYVQHPGSVMPYCGEITITLTSVSNEGSRTVQEGYYDQIIEMWNNTRLNDLARRIVAMSFIDDNVEACDVAITGYGLGCNGTTPNPEAILPDPMWQRETIIPFNTAMGDVGLTARDDLIAQLLADLDEGFTIPVDLIKRGWGGAGLWYNRIAEWNGALATATITMPSPTKLPLISESIDEELKADLESPSNCTRIAPHKPDGDDIDFITDRQNKIAVVLYNAFQYWTCSDKTPDPRQDASGNPVEVILDMALGLGELADIRNAENRNIHPLAQLSAIGKSIIETAVRNLMYSLAFSAAGGISEMIDKDSQLTGDLQMVVSVATGFTTIGLTVGFILYYILPFMPFMYFFFALGKWVKSVFEAMVGVPLWALAHLRVDGNGLPGETASNGYFLILEIFLRPSLCIFGLLASISIFTALARTLNGIWDLAIHNSAGFGCHDDMTAKVIDCTDTPKYRRPVDEFFFTVIYTIILYLMATGSFKLIDQIPSSILRWIGSGAQSFADTTKDDSAASLTRYASIGGNTIGAQAVEAANLGARGAGQAVGLIPRIVKDRAEASAKDARGGGQSTPPPGSPNNQN